VDIGPIHFTNEISFGAILTLLGMAYTCIKYLRHFITDIQVRNERLDKMWAKFNGKGDDDPESWFKRLETMESKVNTIWNKLKFNRITINDARTRHTDG
jgi:hypothetical protein